MSELGTGSGSDYPGTLDTYNDQVQDGIDDYKADHMNDVNLAVIAVQGELGADPAGSAATVAARLSAQHTASGAHGAITATSVDSDNIKIDGNAITSTDSNGDITITPNGTGDIVLDGQKWPQADGSANQIQKTDGSGQLAWVGLRTIFDANWTKSGAIDLSSGSPTSVTLASSMPTGVSQIDIFIQNYSTSAANTAGLIQIGDSGGVEVTGYVGDVFSVNNAANNNDSFDSGFLLSAEAVQDAADSDNNFYVTLTHMGSNVWVARGSGNGLNGANQNTHTFVGVKTLTSVLDRVVIATTAGTATFDAGTAYVRYI